MTELEQDILRTAQTSIAKAIADTLGGYNSPLTKLIISVVDENAKELRAIISDSFTQVIRTDDFKKSIVNAFSHKVSRTIISNNDGLFDKVSNDLKQDAVFKAKLSLAVANVVEECLTEKKK
jgi:predicted oxidoreductase (fatty acid repression mutant protein)